MSYLDLALIFFLLLTILNYRMHRSVLYPPFIFCAMWLLDLAVFRSGLIEVDPLHGNTLAIVAAGAVSFSFGGLLAGLVPRELLRIHLFPSKPEKTLDFLRNILMIVLLCGLPVLFYQTLQISRLVGGGFNILANVYLAGLGLGMSSNSFIFNHFRTIAIGCSLLFSTEKRDRQFWVVTVVALIACILSAGRGTLLLLISGLCGISLLQRKQESLRNALPLLRWPTALFLVLYIGLIFTNRDTEGMTGGVTGIATFYFLSYIVGSLASFDRVVQYPADFRMTTNHTFYFPLHLAAMLHLTHYIAPPKLDSPVLVPFFSNTYTVFKFYFLDLGTVGTMVLLVFIGLIHTLIYLKARQGGRLSIYLFGFSLLSVLTVIGDDSYFYVGEILRAFALGLLYFLIGSVPLRLSPAIKVRLQSKNADLEPRNT